MSFTASGLPCAHVHDSSSDPLILVVDDDPAVRDLTGSMLELKGYSVVYASTGNEAMNLFERFGPRIKLLVIDIVMPIMSGPVIAQQLRERCPNLPILFVSGLASAGNVQGIIGGWFLRKPYTQRSLVNTIRELLTRTSS